MSLKCQQYQSRKYSPLQCIFSNHELQDAGMVESIIFRECLLQIYSSKHNAMIAKKKKSGNIRRIVPTLINGKFPWHMEALVLDCLTTVPVQHENQFGLVVKALG